MRTLVTSVSLILVASASFAKPLNTSYQGKASWYSTSGKRTASGLRHTYGVAHRSLPFGTQLRVTNVANGRQITAVVDDRGPFVRHRVIDVNKATATALGFVNKGTQVVRYQVIK